MKFPAIIIGESVQFERVVDETYAAGTYWGHGIEELFSSASAVELMSEAATEFVDQRLPDGFMSVAKRSDVVHEHPVVVGTRITVRLEVLAFDGYHIQLGMQIHVGNELVLRGHHERSIVNQRWMQLKVKKRAALADASGTIG